MLFTALFSHVTAATIPWETGESRGEDLLIQLVTFGPGDVITTYFGHTAIIVHDKRLDIARLYNFGLFSIEKGFLVNFARGRLIFWAGDARVGPSLLRYARENRDIIIQNLDLPPSKRLEVAKKLAWWVLPGNNSYLYHHYLNNCATIPRDILDEAVDGQLAAATKAPSPMTFRDFTIRYTAHQPALMLLLMFLMNDSIDQPIMQWDDMFLPMELREKAGNLIISDSTYTHPLVSSERTHFKSDRTPVPDQVPSFFLPFLIIGLLTGGLVFLLTRLMIKKYQPYKTMLAVLNSFIGLAFGIPGTALLLMSLFTDHTVTYYNENLFLANPVTLVAGVAALIWLFLRRGYYSLLFYCWILITAGTILLVLLKLLPAFDQDNAMVMAIIIPVTVASVLSQFQLRHTFKKREGTMKP